MVFFKKKLHAQIRTNIDIQKIVTLLERCVNDAKGN